MKKGQGGFTNIKSVLDKYQAQEEDKYISREFQTYGLELAEELGDTKHKALYIKLAKETPRGLLEAAKRFVVDAPNVRSKARLFMWKLSKLKAEKANTQEELSEARSSYVETEAIEKGKEEIKPF